MIKYPVLGILSVGMVLFTTRAKPEVKTNILQDSIKHEASFGMRMRKLPVKTSTIFEPVIVKKAPGNEATIVNLASGIIKIFYVNRPGKGDKLMTISSYDMGISWSDPQKELDLPGEAYYANQVMQDQNGNIHCVFHLYGKGDKGYRGRHLNLWYTYQETGKDWTRPKKIFDGYVGSVRGFVQLKNKTLLIPIYEADPLRADRPVSGETDYGLFNVICLYSDDIGQSWKTSENSLKIPVESTQVTRYGAVEPNVIELKNGKVWMLIRTNKGYLYESFSDNSGKTWQPPQPSSFISSDSPATTLRLADGRILILWSGNQRYDDKRSYANGGREALHAAISGDEGKTWKGFREVLVSPSQKQNEKGDRGTAYPSAVQSPDGKIVFVSGQAEERAIVKFDPDWLEQTQENDGFSKGLVQWTLFGSDSTAKLVLPDYKKQPIGLQIYKLNSSSEAVWNFPMTPKGKLFIDVISKPGNKRINLAFTDHFSVAYDTLASKHAVFNFTIKTDSFKLINKTMKIEVVWDIYTRKAALYLNNLLFSEKAFERIPSFGVNYLRLGIPGKGTDLNGFSVQSVKMITVE